jgi:hypothetical protein
MLTQFQTTEPQAALFAVCPRPRALAFFPALPSAPAAWSPVSAPYAAPVRRAGSAEAVRPLALGAAGAERPATAERPVAGIAFGYGASRVRMGAVRVAAAGGNGEGEAIALIDTVSTQQDKQDKQHLTARREAVTWRPPH